MYAIVYEGYEYNDNWYEPAGNLEGVALSDDLVALTQQCDQLNADETRPGYVDRIEYEFGTIKPYKVVEFK